MTSICPHCSESTTFRPTTDAENPIWFTCESCDEKVTKINHRYSPKIPADAIIIPFADETVQEPENDFDELDKNRVLDSQLKKSLRVADAEEELQDEIMEKKKTLLEQQEIRREVTDYFDDEESDDEEELDIYEPSFTEELARLLKVYQIKKLARQTIIQQSKRLEEEGEFVHPNDLKEKLIGIAKVTDKVANIIMKDYQDLIHRFDGRVEEDYSPSRRSRDYDRGYRRDKPQIMNIQDFIQMEREKEAREAIQDQLADKEFQIQVSMQQAEEWKKKSERIEDEMKELKREHKQELKELQDRIEEFRDKLFDARLDEVKVQASQSFSSDATKLLDKAIDRGVGARALSALTDLNKPIATPMPDDSRETKPLATSPEPTKNVLRINEDEDDIYSMIDEEYVED